jgi:predicted Zn-dependent protease with MMP-like domain
MVGAALDTLPEDLGRLISNVAIMVEHGPGPPGLLGLYQGIPLTERTASGYAGVLPDRITIYRRDLRDLQHRDGSGRGGTADRDPRGGPPFRHRR